MNSEEFKIIELVSNIGMDRASSVFSKSLRTGAKIEIVRLRKVDISEISEEVEKNNEEVSGTIVQLDGDAPIKLFFLTKLESALILTDLFMRRDIGTTKAFDIFTESVIQEVGNVLASSLANTLVKDFNINLHPEPPIVVSDYSSSIFNALLADEAYCNDDEILLIETKFLIVKMSLDCSLFLLPTKKATEVLLEAYKKAGNV